MKPIEKIIMCVVIGGSLIALGFGLQLFGDAFRSNTLLFALLWIGAPIFAYLLNRQLRSGISDDKLAELVMALRDDDRLCIIHEEEQTHEPQLICSLGLAAPAAQG
jgi:hypothetical protein